jgi:hypothetical protein
VRKKREKFIKWGEKEPNQYYIDNMKKSVLNSTCFMLCLVMLTGYGQSIDLKKGSRKEVQREYTGAKILITGVHKEDIDLERYPGRLYVKGNGRVQSGAQIMLKITGLKPGTRIYWSYEFIKGPMNERNYIYMKPFSTCGDYAFNSKDNSTVTNEKGESLIFFTGTTYAGDSFRFGAGFCLGENNEQQFSSAEIKSRLFVVWKRLYLEQPKVLKNVRFPQSTWELVRSNLTRMNIELIVKSKPVELDPFHPRISSYFRGKKDDFRYGPGRSPVFKEILSDICRYSADGSHGTINVVVLGAISEDHDLIKGSSISSPGPPQPANYNYSYKKKDVNPGEFLSYGTAIAMIGDCPAIFIWADYWWVFGKVVKAGHEKCLTRVILHELGHHLLRSQFGKKGEVLDDKGHLCEAVTNRRSIMNGYKLLQSDKAGRVFFSPVTTRKEKKFIKNPTWHPRVEKLIRQYYIPLKQ